MLNACNIPICLKDLVENKGIEYIMNNSVDRLQGHTAFKFIILKQYGSHMLILIPICLQQNGSTDH